MTDEELKAAVATLMAQNANNANAALEAALRKSRRYWDKLKTVEGERDALKAKIPAEGAAVLTADDAKALEAYRALGKPDEVRAALDERKTLEGKVKGAERERLIAKAAEAHGFRSGVLGRLAGEELSIELKDVQKDGKTRPVAYVKAADGQAQPLDDYAKTAWGEFLPALKAEQQSSGTLFIPQSSGGKPPKTDLVAQAIARNRAAADAPNPLKPAVPAKTGA